MRNKLPITVALLFCALLSLAFVQQSKPTQWEYKETQDFRKANQFGAEGWELVAIEGSGVVSRYYFKRPKP